MKSACRALLFLSFALLPRAAAAANYAGILFGASVVNEGRGTRAAIVAHAGTDVSPDWSLGGYLSFEALGHDALDAGVDPANAAGSNAILYAAEANYWLSRDYGFYVGGKAGLGILTDRLVNHSIAGGSSVGLVLGPAAGFVLPLTARFTFGEEMSLLYVGSHDALWMFNVMATFGYRF